MIRKLSATSIASTFTKRSASLASITGGNSDEDIGEDEETFEMPGTPDTIREAISVPSVANLEQGDEHNRLRLPFVEDALDRVTPPTLRALSVDRPKSTGCSRSPQQRLQIMKSPSALQLGEHAVLPVSPSTPTTALHAKSANVPVLKRQASLLSRKSTKSVRSAIEGSSNGRGSRKRRVAGPEEPFERPEDYQQVLARASTSTSSTSASPSKKSLGNRWSRVDVLRRGAVAQGIRGFFR